MFLFYDLSLTEIPWVKSWTIAYSKELVKRGYEVRMCMTMKGLNPYEDAVIMLPHIGHRNLLIEENFALFENGFTVLQMNGSSLNPYDNTISFHSEYTVLKDIDLNICSELELYKDYQNVFSELANKIDYTGFPLPWRNNVGEKKKGLFVIGGRMHPSKGIMHSIYTAINHPEFQELWVCFPNDKYDYSRFLPEIDDIVYAECDHEAFLAILSEAEYFVCHSYNDTLNVSLQEARMLDCKILTHEKKTMWPIYSHIENWRNVIDPSTCTDRLLTSIKKRKQYEISS